MFGKYIPSLVFYTWMLQSALDNFSKKEEMLRCKKVKCSVNLHYCLEVHVYMIHAGEIHLSDYPFKQQKI